MSPVGSAAGTKPHSSHPRIFPPSVCPSSSQSPLNAWPWPEYCLGSLPPKPRAPQLPLGPHGLWVQVWPVCVAHVARCLNGPRPLLSPVTLLLRLRMSLRKPPRKPWVIIPQCPRQGRHETRGEAHQTPRGLAKAPGDVCTETAGPAQCGGGLGRGRQGAQGLCARWDRGQSCAKGHGNPGTEGKGREEQ